MDEAALIKEWIEWIDYTASPTLEEKFPIRKGRGLGHVTLFKILSPRQYFWNG